MALKIEYKAETEKDMVDMLQSLLMVKSLTFLSKKFLATQSELPEGYYELQETFDNILMLLEPSLTYITDAMMRFANPARPGQGKPRNKINTKGGKNVRIK